MPVAGAKIPVDRICCLCKVHGKTLLVCLPRTSPQKYLLPYRDQRSSQDTLYRVLLSPKSQDHFSFWPFGISHTRPGSVSCRVPRRLPSAILLSESRRGCNANCNWRLQNFSLGETAIDILYHMQNPSTFGEVVGWLVLKIAMQFIGLVLA